MCARTEDELGRFFVQLHKVFTDQVAFSEDPLSPPRQHSALGRAWAAYPPHRILNWAEEGMSLPDKEQVAFIAAYLQAAVVCIIQGFGEYVDQTLDFLVFAVADSSSRCDLKVEHFELLYMFSDLLDNNDVVFSSKLNSLRRTIDAGVAKLRRASEDVSDSKRENGQGDIEDDVARALRAVQEPWLPDDGARELYPLRQSQAPRVSLATVDDGGSLMARSS